MHPPQNASARVFKVNFECLKIHLKCSIDFSAEFICSSQNTFKMLVKESFGKLNMMRLEAKNRE